MNTNRPIIGITMGDPAGIGPEILISALETPSLYDICRPLVYGDVNILTRVIENQKSPLRLKSIEHHQDGVYSHGVIDILSTSALDPAVTAWGTPTTQTGRAMIGYIEKAVDDARNRYIQGIATGPITKTAMRLAGSKFHGHTELLAHSTGTENFAMMMAGDRLRVVLATIHIPLSLVSKSLSVKKIQETIEITGSSLKERFGIERPHIAVAGLNPHAGEDGMFGDEERTLIMPAIERSAEKGFDVSGPFPSDTLFFKAADGQFDAVVCMYHDQGLIPFKMIHFSDGVNTTLGLPIIRTSVDHGTAYDIAGRGIADPGSLISAVKMAALQAVNMFPMDIK